MRVPRNIPRPGKATAPARGKCVPTRRDRKIRIAREQEKPLPALVRNDSRPLSDSHAQTISFGIDAGDICREDDAHFM